MDFIALSAIIEYAAPGRRDVHQMIPAHDRTISVQRLARFASAVLDIDLPPECQKAHNHPSMGMIQHFPHGMQQYMLVETALRMLK